MVNFDTNRPPSTTSKTRVITKKVKRKKATEVVSDYDAVEEESKYNSAQVEQFLEPTPKNQEEKKHSFLFEQSSQKKPSVNQGGYFNQSHIQDNSSSQFGRAKRLAEH